MAQIKHALASLIVIFMLFGSTATLSAQTNSIFDLMLNEDVLELTLETDLTALRENRRNDEYVNSFLSFTDINGEEQAWKMKVKTRGKFRRSMCEMPPLKMKFKKAQLAAAGLSDHNDMKLVTHCVADKLEAKELLLKEYLAYQLYEEVTPYSYRTQLVRITYKDVHTGKRIRNWGIVIEDTAQLTERLDAENCKDCYNAATHEFVAGSTKLVNLYQYMIGNSDYSIGGVRNVKVLRKDGKLIPVPYDFDFSGFVNASYAIPNADYDLQYVTDRVYLGAMENVYRLHSTKSYFIGKQKRFYQKISSLTRLNRDSREEMILYLQDFFANIHDIDLRNRHAEDVNNVHTVAK